MNRMSGKRHESRLADRTSGDGSRPAPDAGHGSQTSMTSSNRRSPDVRTEEEFEAALASLLRAAHENDVRVRGCWLCGADEGPRWELLVTEVVRRSRSDRPPE